MGSKGSQTTTQTTTPAPQAMDAYSSLLTGAANVAAIPYAPYGGEMTAPINTQQNLGIGGINAYSSWAQPYLTQGAGYISGAAAPVSAPQIQAYESPYTTDVVNATQAQFADANAQQQQQLLSSAASQGALGGDRTGIAQAVLAGQQQLAQAPVIAGLENTGYNQAVQYAMQEQANQLAAGSAIAGVGTAGQSALLSGANTQVGAGTLEQQTQQAADTAAYNAFLQQQAYPFQTQQWLAGIDTGVGSQMGGTGTTTAPPPSTTAQVAGAIGAGVGAAGWFLSDRRLKEHIHKIGETNDGQPLYRFRYKGDPQWHIGLMAQDVEKDHPNAVGQDERGYKFVNIKEATDDAIKRWNGGRIAGFDSGGVVAPWQMGLGYVPNMAITKGAGPPKPPTIPSQDGAAQMMQNASSLAKTFGAKSPTAASTSPLQLQSGASPSPVGTVFSDGLGGLGGTSGEAIYYSGGVVLPKHNRIDLKRSVPVRGGLGMPSFMPQRRAGFADGGTPTFDERFISPSAPNVFGGDPLGKSDLGPARQEAISYGLQSPYLNVPYNADVIPISDTPQIAGIVPMPSERPAAADYASLPPQITGPADTSPAVNPLAYSDTGTAGGLMTPPLATPPPPPPPPPPVSTDTMPTATAPAKAGLDISPDVWTSLMSAGLGMMASRSPFLGVAIGEGGLQGMATYGELQKQHLAEQKQAADIDYKVKQLNQQAKAEQDRIAMQMKPYSEMTAHEKAQLAQPKAVPVGQTLVNPQTGQPIYTNRANILTNETIDMMADQYLAGDKSVFQNLGRGAQGVETIAALREAIARKTREAGGTGKDVAANVANFSAQTAAARTAAVRSANIDIAVEEARKTFPLALQASQDVPRSQFVPWNRAVQMVQAGTSSPELARFVTANQAVITAYSQSMSRTGVNTVNAQQHAENLLSTATSPEAYAAVIGQMELEMQAAKSSPETVRQQIMGRITGKGGEAAPLEAAPKPKPTQKDIDYARSHPEVRDKFFQRFGVEP